jgi:hypothetical protein
MKDALFFCEEEKKFTRFWWIEIDKVHLLHRLPFWLYTAMILLRFSFLFWNKVSSEIFRVEAFE